ncbi:MAG: cytochrome P450 [Myxococcota bacterium]
MVDYDPFSAEVMENPYPVYARLRAESPVHFVEKYDAWALSKFADIWDLSSHPAMSAARGTTPSQVLTRQQPVTPMLNVMDPPDHTTLRVAIRPRFSRLAMKGLEETIRGIVRDCIDKVRGRGEADVIGDIAAQLSVKVACMAVGIPLEDGDHLSELVWRFFDRDPEVDGMTEDGLRAAQELTAYFMALLENRRRTGSSGEDVVDMFRTIEIGGRKLSDEEIGSHLSMLIIGGSETFPKTFANGVFRLAEFPDQRARLVAEPELIPKAYDEILRYDMPTQFLCRTLTDDIEVRGEKLAAGQAVMFLYPSANRDEDEFVDPDRFDVGRKPRRHLSFGAGTHACLGFHVARMEGKVCFEELLAAFPGYEILHDRAERLRTEFVQGFAALPISFQS